MADTIQLRYTKAGTIYTQSFTALAVKGADDPEKVRFVPPLVLSIVDGSKETQFRGFQRIIDFDLGVVSSATDRKTIQEFLNANTRSILYQGINVVPEEILVVNEQGEIENEWMFDFSLAKRFSLEVVEKTTRTSWPIVFPPEIL